MANVAERVKKIVMEQLGVEEEQVTETASFRKTWAPTRSTPWKW